MIASQLPVFIPICFLVAALLIPLSSLLRGGFSGYLAILASAMAAAMSVYGFFVTVQENAIRYYFGGWQPPIGIEFVLDGLSAFFLMVINSVACVVLVHSLRVAKKEYAGKEMPYYTLAMLLMLGFNGMVLTGDLFNLYVFLEISSLASYALIAIGRKAASVAAFRYLLIGTIGGTFYLLGIGFLYSVTGSLNILDTAAMLPDLASHSAVVTGLLLIVVGVGIKAALFPMHGWLPDAYTHANSTSSALIAPIGTKVAAYILFRIIAFMFGVELTTLEIPLLAIIGALSALGILYGSVMAIAQTDMKRMLAYSSVSQIGYILLGLSLANPMAYIGALLHVLNHAVMKACLFLVCANIQDKEGHTDIRRLDDSYRRKYPITMLAFAVSAISMIGLPPLAGFFSKWYLVLGTIENGAWHYLAVILISSLLNAVYFFRILERVYMKKPAAKAGDESSEWDEVSWSMRLPTLGLAVMLFVIGFGNVVLVKLLVNILPLAS